MQAPTLVVRAAGGFMPSVLFESLAETMPRGRMIEHPAGHLMPMEDPDGVVRLAIDFGGEEP